MNVFLGAKDLGLGGEQHSGTIFLFRLVWLELINYSSICLGGDVCPGRALGRSLHMWGFSYYKKRVLKLVEDL